MARRLAVCGGSPSGLQAVETLLAESESDINVSLFLQLWNPDDTRNRWGRGRKICIDYVPHIVGKVPKAVRQNFGEESFVPQTGDEFSIAPDAMTFCRRWALRLAQRYPGKLRVFAHRDAFSARDGDLQFLQPCKIPFRMHFQDSSQTWRLDFRKLAEDCVDSDMSEEFDMVAVNYDFSFRMTHVKAVRELLDSGMPATKEIIQNVALGLHCAKTMVCAVRVAAPLKGVPHVLHGKGGGLLFAERYPTDPSVHGWQRGPDLHGQFWLIHSTCEFARQRFLGDKGGSIRTRQRRWDKAETGKMLIEEFRSLLEGACSGIIPSVHQLGNTYHWDLPLPLTHPEFKNGASPLLLDSGCNVAWMGDFVGVAAKLDDGDPLFGLSAALAAGECCGSALAVALDAKARPVSSLPVWQYHAAAGGQAETREGNSAGGELGLLLATTTREQAAYRGTCNWKVAEAAAEGSDFKARCAETGIVWLEHLPINRACELADASLARAAGGGDGTQSPTFGVASRLSSRLTRRGSPKQDRNIDDNNSGSNTISKSNNSSHTSNSSSSSNSNVVRVAVLGRTLSSLFFVHELRRFLEQEDCLGAAVEVSLFPAMFDPARNIYTPHPICEYASSNFWASAGQSSRKAAGVAALEEAFAQRYLKLWLEWGLVEEVEPLGGTTDLAGPKAYRSTGGGMFALLASLETQLVEDSQPGRFSVMLHDRLQLTQMKYDDDAQMWSLYSEFGGSGQGLDWYAAHQVPNTATRFDAVVMGFDLDPRGARKASFKQLLESALPTTCPVIRSLASTPCASAMTCVVELSPPERADARMCGGIHYGSEASATGSSPGTILELAEQLQPAQHSLGRGLRLNPAATSEVWSLTANVRWSKSIRNSFSSGRWDKKKVERDLVEAFQREVAPSYRNSRYKGVVPCFHWQGAWPLTAIEKSSDAACVYDASARLGWASDAFVFLNADPSVAAVRQLRTCNLLHAFKSASDLAGIVAKGALSGKGADTVAARLPKQSEWKPRCDLAAHGTGKPDTALRDLFVDTGRSDPQDGIDHTWPTAARLAADGALVIEQADSLKKYRRRNDRQRSRQRRPAVQRRSFPQTESFTTGARAGAGFGPLAVGWTVGWAAMWLNVRPAASSGSQLQQQPPSLPGPPSLGATAGCLGLRSGCHLHSMLGFGARAVRPTAGARRSALVQRQMGR